MADWFGPLIMLLAFFLGGLALGIPMAFVMGVGSIITGIVFYGPSIMQLALTNTTGVMNSQTLVAAPMFIFMAIILEKSGIADALYSALHQWFGGLRGGLAIATVLICAVLGAMSGVAAAGTVTMGLIALPIMLNKGYSKDMALGPILIGGPLGILIPPSIGFIIYGTLTSTSIGRLFAAGMVPGILLVFLYCLYIGIRCLIRPNDGPSIPKEERVSFAEKLKLTKGLILPILIVLGVLGSIFTGIASPTESAAIGAVGAIVAGIIHKKFNWRIFREAAVRTFSTMGMVVWILFGAQVFSSVLISTGIPNMLKVYVASLEVAPILIVGMMMISYFILGCFLEETTMLFITIPIYMPILVEFGYDPLWFGVLFIISMQMAYITPPFGFSLFFLKGIAPEGVTTRNIYHAVPPFLVLQALAVAICMFFPKLVTWLPNMLFN